MAFEKVKRQFIVDAVIIVLIISGVLVYAGVSSMNTGGYSIKGKEVILTDQDKVVRSNVSILEGGVLQMEHADLSLVSGYHEQYGVYISGDSSLKMDDSSITCDEYSCYLIAGADDEGKSPRIELRGSKIVDHTGFLIGERTRLYSENSSVGPLLVQDNAKAELVSSSVYPVLYSGEDEIYEGLDAGESISKKITAREGWEVSMKECTVRGYRLELFENDGVAVRDSTNVSLSLHSPGNIEVITEIDLSFTGERNSGSFEDMWLDLSWTDSVIEYVLLFVTGTDEIGVSGGVLGDIDVGNEGFLKVEGSRLRWERSLISGRGVVELRDVEMAVADDRELELIITGEAHVKIQGSDLTGLHIVLIDSSTLEIEDSLYNMEKIENRGAGDVIIDGESIPSSE
jgi:hypothetical protein